MQATGFLLMLISFIIGFRKISWGGVFSAVTGLPILKPGFKRALIQHHHQTFLGTDFLDPKRHMFLSLLSSFRLLRYAWSHPTRQNRFYKKAESYRIDRWLLW
jgi:hypothetical protein